MGTTERALERVREARPQSFEAAREALASQLMSELADRDRRLHLRGSPAVVLVVGVNGTGKTTTIAKLAKNLIDEGKSVLLAAAGDHMSRQRTHHVTTTDDVTIGGSVHGQGPPLVFLHGMLGDGVLDWGLLAGHLIDAFTCHLPSQRGRGLSGDHPDLS